MPVLHCGWGAAMRKAAFSLAALDLASGKTVARHTLSAEDVDQLYEQEIDTGSGKHLLLFEPLSLFSRRLRLVGGKAVRAGAAFIEKLQEHRHATVLLLKGDASVEPDEVRTVRHAMLQYYSSLKF